MVVLLALAHAGAQALVRPLYQVSDEIVYMSTVQATAWETAPPTLRSCIAPPDARFPFIPVTTKPGFRRATAWQLSTYCSATAGRASQLALRLLQAGSLAVVAACAWVMGHALTGRHTDALLAGLLVAAHPVAAAHAGGVTPDAWANAWSALAFTAGSRMLLQQWRWWDPPLLLLFVVLALAWKDTATFLVVLPVLAVLVPLVSSARGRSALGYVAFLVASVVATASAALLWFRTPYVGGEGRAPLEAPAWLQVVAVGRDALGQVGTLVTSSWVGLGNFGASTLVAPPAAEVIGVALLAAGLAGAVRRLAHDSPLPHAAVVGTWAACAVLCLVQPSVRQVLLGTQDIHQGRWLFPLLAPAAVVLACGINRVRARAALLPLAALASVTAAGLGLLETIRYYWTSYPTRLDPSALYLRGTGGDVIDDRLVLGLVRHAAADVPASFVFIVPLLLGLAAAASLALAFATVDHHDRHTDHC